MAKNKAATKAKDNKKDKKATTNGSNGAVAKADGVTETKAEGAAEGAPTEKKKGFYTTYLKGLGPAAAIGKRIERTVARLEKHASRLRGYKLDELSKTTDEALRLLDVAAKGLQSLPKEWHPPRGAVSAAPIVEGSMVLLREKAAKHYADMFDTAALLKVIQVTAGPKVLVETVTMSGKSIMIPVPRMHIYVPQAEASSAEGEVNLDDEDDDIEEEIEEEDDIETETEATA